LGALERFAFCEAASKGAAVVRTSEFRPTVVFFSRWALFLTADVGDIINIYIFELAR
jgi:hypothetical protein